MDGFLGDFKKLCSMVLRWFISGFLILLPLGATMVLLGWIFDFLNKLVGGESVFAVIWQILFGWFNFAPTLALIMGYLMLLFVITVVGYFTQGFAKNSISAALRAFFDRIPIINKIYQSFDQLFGLWSDKQSGRDISKIGEVVIVNFANTKAFGVLSSRQTYKIRGEEHYLVYLPSSPIPATGFNYFLKKDDVYWCGMTMEEMSKVVVSLGVLGHEVMGAELDLHDDPHPVKPPSPTTKPEPSVSGTPVEKT
ncbi:MAG: DUF502 domain-containing protein [bacterium]|nr:DUF502 domain-containing protein [bacterium]